MEFALPSSIGIWRLGKLIHQSEAFCVTKAQPVDARQSPKWDYVLKFSPRSASRLCVATSISLGQAVQHPNLVPVLDGDANSVTPFLVMPNLGDKTMRRCLSELPSKPLPVALWLVRQVCQGLEAMHSSGWIHRDVKPENIMVGSNGHVTLVDMAFAHQGIVPQESAFAGTPQYSAPEVLANATTASNASDVFAVGRILWEWLTCVQTSDDLYLQPVCQLVEQMCDERPLLRPSAGQVARALLKLEIDTLGQHIEPGTVRRAA